MVSMGNSAPQEDDDAALVARSLDGDREAFGCLYDRYARLVRALSYDRFTDYALAQDLTQETFLRAYQKLRRLRRPERFGPWLVGITRRLCREKRRSLRRDRHQFIGANPWGRVAEPQTAERIEALEDQERILGRVAELPEKERLAIHAFYLQGQSIQQTAALLGLSRSGVYALLRRGCQRLARQLRREERGVETIQ